MQQTLLKTSQSSQKDLWINMYEAFWWMPTDFSLNHVCIASLTKHSWPVVSSAARNSHQGHHLEFPKKQTQIYSTLQELISKCHWDQHCGKEGGRQHWAEGEDKLLRSPKDNVSRPPWGVLKTRWPSTVVLYWDEKAGICSLWTHPS